MVPRPVLPTEPHLARWQCDHVPRSRGIGHHHQEGKRVPHLATGLFLTINDIEVDRDESVAPPQQGPSLWYQWWCCSNVEDEMLFFGLFGLVRSLFLPLLSYMLIVDWIAFFPRWFAKKCVDVDPGHIQAKAWLPETTQGQDTQRRKVNAVRPSWCLLFTWNRHKHLWIRSIGYEHIRGV